MSMYARGTTRKMALRSAIEAAAFPVTVIPQAPTITVFVGQPVAGQSVELKGTGQNGDTVTIYANGGSTPVGVGLVAGGVFDIVTTATFLDGVQSFTATQTDLAGLTSSQGTSFAVAVAPLTPTVGAIVGQPVSGQAVEVTGTGQTGDVISLYADDGLTVNRWLTTGMLAASASSNESGYLTQKVARSLGLLSFDNQARV